MKQINFNEWAIKLFKGSHRRPADGMCIMECVAYIQGEEHTDHPQCACPVVTAFAINLNDKMKEEERQQLLPFVLRIAGSKGSKEIEVQRGFMAADYAVRIFASIAMSKVNLEQAEKLKNCRKIVDAETALEGGQVAYAAAADAAYAAAAVYAAVYAVYAAVYAVYAADAAAVYAADAAYAAAAVDNKAMVIEFSLQLLDDMLKLTEQIEETPLVESKLQELVQLTNHV